MRYFVKLPMRALCCNTEIAAGETVEFVDQTSSNRIRVKRADGGIHKVRASTLRRCTDDLL